MLHSLFIFVWRLPRVGPVMDLFTEFFHSIKCFTVKPLSYSITIIITRKWPNRNQLFIAQQNLLILQTIKTLTYSNTGSNKFLFFTCVVLVNWVGLIKTVIVCFSIIYLTANIDTYKNHNIKLLKSCSWLFDWLICFLPLR